MITLDDFKVFFIPLFSFFIVNQVKISVFLLFHVKQYSFFSPKTQILSSLVDAEIGKWLIFSAQSAQNAPPAPCLFGLVLWDSRGFLLRFSWLSLVFLVGFSRVFGVFYGFSRIVSRETFKKGAKSCLKTAKTAHKRAFSLVFVVFSSLQQRNAVLAPGDQKHYRNNTNGNCKGKLQRGAAKEKYKEELQKGKRKRKQNEEAQREV